MIAAGLTKTRVVFLGKSVRSAAKSTVVDKKCRKALAMPCLMSEPLPNAASSSNVLRLDSILRELRTRVFFLGKCVRTAAKTMVVDRKNQKAPALLYLRSGPLRNTANSSVVQTPFVARNRQQICL